MAAALVSVIVVLHAGEPASRASQLALGRCDARLAAQPILARPARRRRLLAMRGGGDGEPAADARGGARREPQTAAEPVSQADEAILVLRCMRMWQPSLAFTALCWALYLAPGWARARLPLFAQARGFGAARALGACAPRAQQGEPALVPSSLHAAFRAGRLAERARAATPAQRADFTMQLRALCPSAHPLARGRAKAEGGALCIRAESQDLGGGAAETGAPFADFDALEERLAALDARGAALARVRGACTAERARVFVGALGGSVGLVLLLRAARAHAPPGLRALGRRAAGWIAPAASALHRVGVLELSLWLLSAALLADALLFAPTGRAAAALVLLGAGLALGPARELSRALWEPLPSSGGTGGGGGGETLGMRRADALGLAWRALSLAPLALALRSAPLALAALGCAYAALGVCPVASALVRRLGAGGAEEAAARAAVASLGFIAAELGVRAACARQRTPARRGVRAARLFATPSSALGAGGLHAATIFLSSAWRRAGVRAYARANALAVLALGGTFAAGQLGGWADLARGAAACAALWAALKGAELLGALGVRTAAACVGLASAALLLHG